MKKFLYLLLGGIILMPFNASALEFNNDSVVTDIYRKKNRKRQLKNSVAQGTKVVKRIATDEEKEKYGIKD